MVLKMPSAGGHVPTHTDAPASASAFAMARLRDGEAEASVVRDSRHERPFPSEINRQHGADIATQPLTLTG
jgi:hypothetical protein